MKFVVAVVMLICALAGVQSSVLSAPGVSVWGAGGPWAGGHWGGAWGGAPWGGAPWGGAWGHGPAAVAVHASAPWGVSAPGLAIPGISLAQGPGHAGVIAPKLWGGHEGVYVAKTRGAVHTAPLAGHINSATSINVAPAPGTL